MRVEIRRIGADEGPLLMQVRLLSLLDAPYAFASTYTESIQQPSEHWDFRARSASAGGATAVYVAVAAGGPVGIAGAYQPAAAPEDRRVYGVWVEPMLRGQGLGRRLVETIVDWAEAVGANTTSLWVSESNTPALALYESMGFTDTGTRQPFPSDETVIERKLVRPTGRERSA